MPTKEKEIKSAELRAQREKLDRLIGNAPPHIKARLGAPSQLSKSLHTALWNGLVLTEDGELGLHPKHGSGANNRRQAASMQEALKLQEDYPEKLWQRHGASDIAKKEGISASNVRRAKGRLRQNEQAK